VPVSRSKLIQPQESDPKISSLYGYVLPEDELDQVPRGYFMKNGGLMRMWRPPNVPATEDWYVLYQLVMPQILSIEGVEIST